MRNLYVGLLLALLSACPLWAQTVLSDVTLTAASSDHSGPSSVQVGTEVLRSTVGVNFEPTASFEHIGQFYLAADGLWNPSGLPTTDYFGYAPGGLGTGGPYQGQGIIGASARNGGQGAGQPTFGHLQLNSTGPFPLVAGMRITHSLRFNVNGPAQSSIITTPAVSSPSSAQGAVIFAPEATITGYDNANYLDGYASVIDPPAGFTLPIGDAMDIANRLHPLTVRQAVVGTVTARYQYALSHSPLALGMGIRSVSTFGSWPISAPVGTLLSVNLPALGISPQEAINLRLVGWNGQQWIDLSGTPTNGACVTGNCPLSGVLKVGITDLAIGSVSDALAKASDNTGLLLWPNPVQNQLNLRILSSPAISMVNVLDTQGRLVLRPTFSESSINTSSLPAGGYILDVQTQEGHSFRKPFVKQP